MLGEYGIYGQIRAILTAMFNSLMPSLNSRSRAFCGIFGWISKQMHFTPPQVPSGLTHLHFSESAVAMMAINRS